MAHLETKSFGWLKNKGRLQFRLSFERPDNDDLLPDYIGWCSGDVNIPEWRPVLEIIYR